MIRMSFETAIELSIKKGQSDISTTTAYILIENDSRKNIVSKDLWPECTKREVLQAFKSYKGENIKRICLKSIDIEQSYQEVIEFIKDIKKNVNIPISLSANIEEIDEIEKFLELGVEKVGLYIEVANEYLYKKIKGNNFYKKIDFIKEAGLMYPNRISTHIIVGLGESHKDIYDLYKTLRSYNIIISLFDYSSINTIKLNLETKCSIESYRRVQLMTYMMDKGYNRDYFKFGLNGYLEELEIDEYIKNDILKGKPFKTRGCKNCNRPHSSKNSRGIIYNYSRNLNKEEIKLAIKDINLGTRIIQ